MTMTAGARRVRLAELEGEIAQENRRCMHAFAEGWDPMFQHGPAHRLGILEYERTRLLAEDAADVVDENTARLEVIAIALYDSHGRTYDRINPTPQPPWHALEPASRQYWREQARRMHDEARGAEPAIAA